MSDHADGYLEFRRYLAPVIRHRSLILSFCGAATLSSLMFTYVVSEKYFAATTVLYQPREAVSFRPKTRDALGFPMPLVALESIGNTLESVLKSDGVLEHVVRTLHLDVKVPKPAANRWVAMYRDTKDKVKEWRQDAMQLLKYGRLLQLDPTQQAMLTLRSNVGIKRANKTYTFEVQAVDPDPARAALIVDTIAKALADFLGEEQVKEARGAREKIEPRLQQSVAEIAGMRTTLEQFKTKSGVSSLPEELSLKLRLVSTLQQELTSAENELRALQQKQVTLDGQLKVEKPSIPYSSTTSSNPLVEQLRLDLARFDVERSGLLEKYTSNHQEVRAVDARIQQVRDRLSRELEKTVSSESVQVNDIYQKVLGDKLANDAEIATLSARAGSLVATIQKETATAQRLMRNEPRLNELAYQLKSAEDTYQLLHETYEEARLAESKASPELIILSDAIVPRAPARPIKILHVATSFVLSLVLAIGFCFFLDAFDSSLRTIEQAEETLGVPVFATIPALSAGQSPGKPLLRL